MGPEAGYQDSGATSNAEAKMSRDKRHRWCLPKPERIDSQMVDIRCPCPESNQDIIQLSEAGEEI